MDSTDRNLAERGSISLSDSLIDLEAAGDHLVIRDHATRRELTRYSKSLARTCIILRQSLFATDLEQRLVEVTPGRLTAVLNVFP